MDTSRVWAGSCGKSCPWIYPKLCRLLSSLVPKLLKDGGFLSPILLRLMNFFFFSGG